MGTVIWWWEARFRAGLASLGRVLVHLHGLFYLGLLAGRSLMSPLPKLTARL